MTVVVTGVC